MAALLAERYGFEVTLLRDATARDIMRAFERLRRTLTENDNLLVYFAGHGTYADLNDLQRGYWIPVDGEPDALFTWISTDQIVEQTDAMSAKQVLIVADSCFSGAFMRTRSALARLSAG
ncbi:caspase family protein, partial [Arthrospira platensis SPKY1]|nr:caspase family protein [Arthrospira platensis SPKY1]